MNIDLKSTLCFPITACQGLLVLSYERRLLLKWLCLCCAQQMPLHLNRPLLPPTRPLARPREGGVLGDIAKIRHFFSSPGEEFFRD